MSERAHFHPLVAVAIGLGLVFFPTTVVAVMGASRQTSGLAAAVLNVSQQVGGSTGLAVLGAVAANTRGGSLAGFTMAFEIGAVIALAGALVAYFVLRARAEQAPPGALAEAA